MEENTKTSVTSLPEDVLEETKTSLLKAPWRSSEALASFALATCGWKEERCLHKERSTEQGVERAHEANGGFEATFARGEQE